MYGYYKKKLCQSLLGVKGLIPMSDQDRISPSNIKTISNTQVLENKENMNLGILSWSNNKLSKPKSQKLYDR